MEGFNHSYCVIGTGALGGLYGGLLARAGADVHFLMRGDYAAAVNNGIRVDTPLGDFHLERPRVYQNASDLPKVDVAIVAWKTTANEQLSAVLRQVCGPESCVLVLQNGWDVEKVAADTVGAKRVLGGCCFLCSNKVGPAHIKHLDYGMISFGEYDSKLAGNVTPRMQSITDDFTRAGMDMRPTENLRVARWQKLTWNIPFNSLSVILNADTAQLMENPGTLALVRDLMHEVHHSAASCGDAFPESHIEKMLENTRKMVPYDSSMRLDYLARRPMVIEAIVGSPLRAAMAAGYQPAKIEMLYQQLLFADSQPR